MYHSLLNVIESDMKRASIHEWRECKKSSEIEIVDSDGWPQIVGKREEEDEKKKNIHYFV